MLTSGRLTVTGPDGQRNTYFLKPGSLSLGRRSDNDIVLLDAKVSRQHARLECGPDSCRLTDLGSAQGTWVNGQRTTAATVLSDGDEVQLGDCRLRFEAGGGTPGPGDDEVTIQAGVEPRLDEPGDLESTVTMQSVEHALADTGVPRVVVCGPGGTREVSLPENQATIGRGLENTMVLEDRMASRRHAVLEREGHRAMLRDLGSANGTWVRGQRVERCCLEHGDAFQIGSTHFIFKAAFQSQELGRAQFSAENDKAASRPGRHPIVVVPGIMGSELWLGQELIWPNLVTLFRRPQVMGLPDQGLQPRRIAQQIVIVPNFLKLEAYSHLTRFLEETLGYQLDRDLLEFAYDWRQDNRESARKLAEAIADWRRRVLGENVKVTIVAHSMGCLVSRYFVECLGGAEAVDRLIFMGGPHAGSASIVQAILSGPRMLPLGLGNRAFQQVLVTFPSVYQLVPTGPAAEDSEGRPLCLLDHDGWVDPQHRHLLHGAVEFHRELGHRRSVPAVCIFGYGIRTATKIVVDSPDWDQVRFIMQPSGDCRVAQESAVLAGAEIHPVHQYHGALWTDNDVKMRLKLELTRGPA